MNTLLKNWLSLNKVFFLKRCCHVLILSVLLFSSRSSAQIGNYVNNGSFEDLFDCNLPSIITKAIFWNGIDSLNGGWAELENTCYSNVPLHAAGFQWPKNGNSFVRSGFLCQPPSCSPDLNRVYLKNRMKSNLKANKAYCVSFYVNIYNSSTYGIDGFAAFFGDNSLDTIQRFGVPLTYLLPQIQNPNNNIITDTLNWTLITGTFVATGNEKFMVIGNFKADANTNKTLINPTYLPAIATDVYVDAISCIELNLPAYAGPDKSVVPGDSVYIGRESDFAIDPGCRWYQFPNMATPITTISGMWVKPSVTTTYVVRQILDCSSEKWDTVVVYMNPLGLENYLRNEELKIYPIPANENLELNITNEELFKGFNTISIYNNLGQILREEEVVFKYKKAILKISDLSVGIYSIRITNGKNETVSKKFVISR